MNNQDVQITLYIYQELSFANLPKDTFQLFNQVVYVDNFKMNHRNQVGVNKF
jgi:hypothetical protein